MRIDRKLFFDALRASPLNGGKLNQMTVDCANGILDAAETYGVKSVEHLAVIFGQCHHEGGDRLAAVKETVYASHADQNPSDATVAARLESSWKRGVMPWVKTPYWRRDGNGQYWFGRGLPQTTHKVNYEKMGREIGVNLVANPDLALLPKNSGLIAVAGMVKGMFRGVKLSDCRTRADYRKIINGDYRDAALQAKLSKLYDAYSAVIQNAVLK